MIEPTDPDTSYVPVYDPGVAHGAWDHPAYQPVLLVATWYVAPGVIGFGTGVANQGHCFSRPEMNRLMRPMLLTQPWKI